MTPTIEPARAASVGLLAEHLVALADLTLPRARTLSELVENYAGLSTDNGEQDCLANAVYFEARGEPIEGQPAVAEVVLNRDPVGPLPEHRSARSSPSPGQFSFVRRGRIPAADRSPRILASRRRHRPHRRGLLLAACCRANAPRYHAEYVSPSWGRRLARNTKIGLHTSDSDPPLDFEGRGTAQRSCVVEGPFPSPGTGRGTADEVGGGGVGT